MRVAFTPVSYSLLRQRGLGLNYSSPRSIPNSFRAEAPSVIVGVIEGDEPVEIGAFSTDFGGRLRDVEIGRYCTLARGLQMGHDEHPTTWVTTSMVGYVANVHGWQDFLQRPDFVPTTGHRGHRGRTRIGHDVWTGADVILRSGITIGNGAVIGARSLVLTDVPPYAIVGGVPARIIRYRFSDTTIDRLQQLAWWRFNIMDIPPDLRKNPEEFIPFLEEESSSGRIQEYAPGWITADEIKNIVEHPPVTS